MIRPLAAAVLATCALFAAPALAAGDNSPAVKAFRGAAKPLLSTFAGALRDIERGLADDLDAAVAAPTASETLLAELVVAYRTACSAAFEAQHAAVDAADDAATQALLDGSVVSTPGLTVGAGGALDDFRARLASETTRFDANVRKATGKALKKARKGLGADAVLTVVTFPLPLFNDVDPGQVVPSGETGFLPRVPLALMGYGDPTARRIAFVATGQSVDANVLNVYDGDGVLIVTEEPVSPIPADLPLIGGVFDMTGDVPAAHGNLRTEVFVTGSDGWTRSIGH